MKPRGEQAETTMFDFAGPCSHKTKSRFDERGFHLATEKNVHVQIRMSGNC